jgi:hypothetical protein
MRFRKTLAFLILATGLVFALSLWAQQQRPLTQDQVQSLVRSGLGDETGAKAIEQRGIDFAPAEDFLQTLKAAGASEAFLNALRAAKPPAPASAKKPMNKRLRLKGEPSCTNDTNAETVYPDIIVHHRGKEKQNLLVIEAKKKSNRSQLGRDENKLRSFADELGYQYCVLVIFDVDRVCHRFTKPAPRAD